MNEGTGLHPAGAWPEPTADDVTSSSSGLLGALPEGWVMLGRCRTGTAGPASYPTGCWALAHPTTGVALVDVAPDATPNAEARLRRALGSANFWPAFPGYLPVWHGRIELAAWRALPGIMAEGFAELPPLTVPGKGAWIAAARAALAEDPAWEVPGAASRGATPMPALGVPDEEYDELPVTRRPWQGRMGLLLGFAVTFVVGLASGVMLLSGEAPAPAAPPPIELAAKPVPLSVAAPAPAPVREVAPAPAPALPVPREPELATAPAAPVTPVQAAVAAPVPATPPAPAPAPVVQQAPPPPVVQQTAAPPPSAPAPVVDRTPAVPAPARDAASGGSGADTAAPIAVASAALPLPPVAPKAPVHKASRPAERIDRACTAALFRFQQGLPLSPAEAAHVRNGCATRR